MDESKLTVNATINEVLPPAPNKIDYLVLPTGFFVPILRANQKGEHGYYLYLKLHRLVRVNADSIGNDLLGYNNIHDSYLINDTEVNDLFSLPRQWLMALQINPLKSGVKPSKTQMRMPWAIKATHFKDRNSMPHNPQYYVALKWENDDWKPLFIPASALYARAINTINCVLSFKVPQPGKFRVVNQVTALHLTFFKGDLLNINLKSDQSQTTWIHPTAYYFAPQFNLSQKLPPTTNIWPNQQIPYCHQPIAGQRLQAKSQVPSTTQFACQLTQLANLLFDQISFQSQPKNGAFYHDRLSFASTLKRSIFYSEAPPAFQAANLNINDDYYHFKTLTIASKPIPSPATIHSQLDFTSLSPIYAYQLQPAQSTHYQATTGQIELASTAAPFLILPPTVNHYSVRWALTTPFIWNEISWKLILNQQIVVKTALLGRTGQARLQLMAHLTLTGWQRVYVFSRTLMFHYYFASTLTETEFFNLKRHYLIAETTNSAATNPKSL